MSGLETHFQDACCAVIGQRPADRDDIAHLVDIDVVYQVRTAAYAGAGRARGRGKPSAGMATRGAFPT